MEERRCLGCMRIKGPGEVCEHCGYREGTPNAPHQLAAGAVLKEQYRIGRVLGQGGFGITYLGWDLYLDIPVAIKEYYPSGMVMRDTAVTMAVTDVTGDEDGRFHHSRDRFMREAKMLARFSQMDEVVQVKNFFLANNTAYIVMEYVEGITLKQYVKDRGGKIAPKEAFSILRPVIRTLSKVHKTGIIHRDISPENIMMLPEGGAKLLDFGAVRSVGAASTDKELTKSTEAILKQGYAPLEQYQKKGSLGPWTDVYAMCGTLYYCMTGTVPPDAPARVLGYEELDLSTIAGLTERQRQALQHGMELRAENRTADMQSLYEELFPPAQPAPQPQPEPEVVPEPRKKAKKSSSGWILTLAAVVAVVALGLAVWRGLTGPEEALPGSQVEIGGKILESGTCGEDLRWSLDENGILAVEGTGPMDRYDEVWNPEEIQDEMNLPPWQDYKDQIRRVILADGVETVGAAAFMNCENLDKVNFGTTVAAIEWCAFCNTGLTEVQLPQSLVDIGHSAFESTFVSQVSIPNNVESVGHFAFGNCPNLESVSLGSKAMLNLDWWSGVYAFSRPDSGATQVLLRGPSGGMAEDYARIYGHPFESTGKTVFEGSGYMGELPGGGDVNWYFDRETHYLKLEGSGKIIDALRGSWEDHVQDPPEREETVPGLPWDAFREEIHVAYISPGITQIPENCFENCNFLTNLYIPDTVEFIGFQAFLATNVDEIVLPESVRTIESCAFNYCNNLRLAALPLSLKDLEQGVFNMCPNLERLYLGNNVTVHYDLAANRSPFANGIENVYPQNLTVFSPQDGEGNPVRQIAEDLGMHYETGMFRFDFAEAMGQMVYRESDVYWVFQDGVLTLIGNGETPFYRTEDSDRRAWGVQQPEWKRVSGEAPWYPYRNQIIAVFVEPGITVLNRGALCDLPNLEYLHLGNLKMIGAGAIDNCGIDQMWINDTTHTLEALAITDCPNLRRLEIHNGCGYLGQGALKGNTALEELYFFSGGEKFSGDLFDGEGPGNLKIYARPNSPAAIYAEENGYPCEIVPW